MSFCLYCHHDLPYGSNARGCPSKQNTHPWNLHVFALYGHGRKCECGRIAREPCRLCEDVLYDALGCAACGHGVLCHAMPVSEWLAMEAPKLAREAEQRRVQREERKEQYRIDLVTGEFVKQAPKSSA